MHRIGCSPFLQLFERSAKIVEELAIDGLGFAVRGQDRKETGYPVNCGACTSFAFAQRLLRAHELFNIQSRPNPQQESSIACPERFHASEEPAVVSLSAANSIANLTALASAQTA